MRRAIQISVALLAFTQICFGQSKGTKISILNSKLTTIDQTDQGRVFTLVGNVILGHEGAKMHCDSAVLYNASNTFVAFGNIFINQHDTLTLTGKTLDYNGNSKVVAIDGDVKLQTKDMRLITKAMRYNRESGNAYYSTRSTLYRNELTLDANSGVYNTKYKRATFKGEVIANDPEYHLETDTLVYYPQANKYIFYGPSVLEMDSSTVWTSWGRFDVDAHDLFLAKRAWIHQPKRKIAADSMYYNTERENGFLQGNAAIADSSNDYTLAAQVVEFGSDPFKVTATEEVYYAMVLDADTLYCAANSLVASKDTAGNRTALLDGNTSLYSLNFQSTSQALLVNEEQSYITLYPSPTIWAQGGQYSADTMWIKTDSRALDSIYMMGHVESLRATEDSAYLDGLKGKVLQGDFEEDKLTSVRVQGNAQSVVHQINDGSYAGTNTTKSSWIALWFTNGALERIISAKDVDAVYTPEGSGAPVGSADELIPAPTAEECSIDLRALLTPAL